MTDQINNDKCKCGTSQCQLITNNDKKITYKKFLAIFENEDTEGEYDGDDIIDGIEIMKKYMKKPPYSYIVSAEHDQIWSVGIEDLIKGGITEGDAIRLREMGWMEDCDALSHFV